MENKESKNYYYYMYKRLFLCIITNKIFIALFCFIEFIDIFSFTVGLIPDFFNYGKKYNDKEVVLVNFLFNVSPFNHFFNYLVNNDNFTIKKIPTYFTILLFIILWIFFYISLYSFQDFDYERESTFQKIKSIIIINFYSYFFLRIFGIFGVDCTISLILSIIFKSEYNFFDILKLFILILLTIGDILSRLIYFTQFSVLLKFKFHESDINKYPFDTFIGEQCDKVYVFIKILISIQYNYYFLNQKLVTIGLLFIDFLTIMGILSLGFYIFYIFFIDTTTLVYITINEITLFRIICINQCCVSIILFFIFYSHSSYILFTCFTIIYFILQFIITITNFNKYITSQAILSKNILGVCWFFQTNDISQNNFITSWIVNHKINCSDLNCEICEELNQKKNDEEHFEGLDNSPKKKGNHKIKKIMSQIPINNEENKNLIESYNINSINKAYSPFNFINKLSNIAYKNRFNYGREDILRLDFIFLTVLFLSENQQFRFYRKIFVLSNKYKKQERVVSMLRTIKELVKNSHKEIIDKYNFIKKNEDLKNDIIKYINDFENFLLYESKTPENYIEISNKFSKIKKNKNLEIITKKNIEYDYQMVLLRYIYETLVNSKIKNASEFDINYYNDFLNFHSKNDKIMLLYFSIERRIFTIIRGSKEILPFSGKNLDYLFPDFFKYYGINAFVEKLKNENILQEKNNIEFISKDFSYNDLIGYISSFKIEYSVYPTIKTEELLIDINYMFNFTKIIIFKIDNDSNEEYLFSLSSSLFKFFGVTPEILVILNKSEKKIFFHSFFTQIGINCSKSKYSFLFLHNEYLKYHKKLLNVEGLNECLNYEEMKNYQINFKKLISEKREIYFKLMKKFICDNSRTKYIVYHIKEQKKKNSELVDHLTILKQSFIIADLIKNNENEIIDVEEENENKENIGKINLKNLHFSGVNLSIFSQASMSAVSLNKNSIIGIKGKINNKKEEKTVKYIQVYYFTLGIFFYGFSLMILTLIFLIVVLKENNFFKQIFDLFHSFRQMQRNLESISLSLFSNFCYYSGGNNNCVNYYEIYSYNLTNQFISFKNIPLIYNVILNELTLRFEITNSIFFNFEKDVYDLNFKKINYIKQFKIEKYKILIDDDYINILRDNILFMDLIREYINWITQITNNNKYLTEKFYLFNLEMNKLNNEILIPAGNNIHLNQFQKNMFLIVLNCPLIHFGLNSCSEIIKEEFQLVLKQLNSYLLCFFLVLLFLHVILYITCNIFLNIFLKMFKSNILPMNIQFENKNYFLFIKQKYLKLKELCYFYQDNPNNIINTININRKNFKKEEKEKLNKTNKNEEINENKSFYFPQLNKSHFVKLIRSYQVIILISFLLYFIYAIVFYVYIHLGKNKLNSLVEYSIINQQLDSLTYDNFNSLIYLILTNSSRYDIGERIYNKKNYDYLFEKMNYLHQIIREKETMEFVHKKTFPPMNTIIDLNFLNGKIYDETFNTVLNNIGGDLNDFLKVLSNHFPVSTIGDDTMFIKNVLYLLNQLYNQYFNGKFHEIENQINSDKLFNLYTFVLIINKIMRYYFNESIFIKEIDKVFNHFSSLIIPYLVLNMILEIVIFLILYFYIVSKIKITHNKLSSFIKSLTVK